MARRVIDNIGDIAEQLRDQGAEAERLGRMPTTPPSCSRRPARSSCCSPSSTADTKLTQGNSPRP